MENKPQIIITQPTKNIGISLLLTALFGPLGMLYSTITGAIIMGIVYALIALFTLGFGLAFIWILNPICMIWSYISTKKYNKNLLEGSES